MKDKTSLKARRRTPPKNINLRVKPQARALIDRACALTNKTVTEFVLDAVCREAEDVLLERQLFQLDTTKYRAFIAALDAPPGNIPRLKKLLNRKPLWEN